MTAKERLKAYLDYKKITQIAFAESIGASTGYVNAMSKGFGPKYEAIVREKYPDLNIGWVITGDGDMLSTAAHQVGVAIKADTESVVMINFIPVHASASFVESICDEKECAFEKMPVIPLNGEKLDSSYKIFEVSGDSMVPTINDGALILAKEINEAQWAYAEGVVVVVFNEMVVIKRMAENRIFDSNMIVLSSDNEKYGKMQIELSNIRAIYKAKRKISENIF